MKIYSELGGGTEVVVKIPFNTIKKMNNELKYKI